jgi:lambda family phage portal protein
MKLFDQFLSAFGLSRKSGSSSSARAFAAAQMNRFTQDWKTQMISPNLELRTALKKIRERARDLQNNNDYVAKYAQLVEDNVVGPKGIQLQARVEAGSGRNAGKLDDDYNGMIETAWEDWGGMETCTTTKSMSWIDLKGLIAVSLKIEGEVFIHYIRGANNDYGFSIELIDPDQVDADYNNVVAFNGNRIYMGIEVDEFAAPVAYYILKNHPSEGNQTQRIRVPADQIRHVFKKKRFRQVRGIPQIVSAILRLRQLGMYEEAELMASRMAACKMAVLTSELDVEEYNGEDEDEDGKIELPVQPGTIEELPPGVSLTAVDWKHPTTAYEFFAKSQVRAASVGMGVSYASLSEDLTEVNFSSIRTGMLAERTQWQATQQFLIRQALFPIFKEWFKVAVLLKNVIPLKYDIKQIFSSIHWQPRGWGWVDPFKDMQANVLALENNLDNATDILAASGRDPEDIWKRRKKEIDLLAELGLPLVMTVDPKEKPPQDGAQNAGGKDGSSSNGNGGNGKNAKA